MKTYKHNEEFPSECGIYFITFENSKKFYIGSAFRFDGKFNCKRGFCSRWRVHLQKLKSNKHHSIKLQNAFNKYGLNQIIFGVIEVLQEANLELENFYINHYDSFNYGYNCRPEASSMIGFSHSSFSKNKMSESKNRKMREAVLQKSEVFKELYDQGFSVKEIRRLHSIPRRQAEKIMEYLSIVHKEPGFFKRKKIYCYEIATGIISEYCSLSECERQTGVDSGKISFVAQGKGKSSKGYTFSYNKLTKEEFQSVKSRKK